MINPVVNSRLSEVKQLFKDNAIERAYIFGSVCTPAFNDKSDIDFIIAFRKNISPFEVGDNYFKVLNGLREIFDRDIDLLTEDTLSNPYLIKVINKTKITVYE